MSIPPIVIYLIVLQTAFRRYENKNYKIKTSYVSPEGPKARTNKTGINFMIF